MINVDSLRTQFKETQKLKKALISSRLVLRSLFIHATEIRQVVDVVSSHDELPLIPYFMLDEAPLSEKVTKEFTREGASIIVLKDGTKHLVAKDAWEITSDVATVLDAIGGREPPKGNHYYEDLTAHTPFIRFEKIEIIR